MADEVTYSALSDATVAATLHQELLQKMGDRHSLWGHPGIRYIGSVNGTGSAVKKATLWGADTARMGSVADGSSVSNTAIGSYVGSVSVTVARQSVMLSSTDLAGLTWGHTPASLVEKIAEGMASNAKLRFQEMVCDVLDGFTTVVGSSGVDFSVTNWFSAKAALMGVANQGSSYLAVLHPTQLADLVASLRAETGALSFHDATPEMMAIKGQGYAGYFDGVDFYISSLVPTANAGADRAGSLFATGAVCYADGLPTPQVAVGGIAIGSGPIYVEAQRNAAAATTSIVGNYYVGVAKCEDGLGVSIITDA